MSETPSPAETFTQISKLVEKLNKEADFNTRLSIIEKTHKNGEAIDLMIWARIKKNQENLEKNKINFNAIIQSVIIAVTTAMIVTYLMKGS